MSSSEIDHSERISPYMDMVDAFMKRVEGLEVGGILTIQPADLLEGLDEEDRSLEYLAETIKYYAHKLSQSGEARKLSIRYVPDEDEKESDNRLKGSIVVTRELYTPMPATA